MVASWHWKDIVETIKKHYPEYSVPPSRNESRMSNRSTGEGVEVSKIYLFTKTHTNFEFYINSTFSN